jgi:hypothetical protein
MKFGLDRPVSRRDVLKGMAAFGAAAVLGKFAPTASAAAPKPVRFALLGDWGSGDDGEFAIAEKMLAAHHSKPLELVIGAGDNIYPNGSADHFGENFERPFEALIKERVPFHTCFGNHDVRSGADAQLRYPLFNMNGRNYYNLAKGDGTVEFFMLDSNDMDDRQLRWLEGALAASTAVWKVPVFHHPIYSSGKTHGASADLRKQIEPLFVRSGVKVAFSGHDHIYQRVTPQQGVQYFVSGAGGKIREGNLKRDSLVASGYDADSHFMTIEADATSLRFSAVNASGQQVDSGVVAAS